MKFGSVVPFMRGTRPPRGVAVKAAEVPAEEGVILEVELSLDDMKRWPVSEIKRRIQAAIEAEA
jgi:hypothetical protein